MCQPHIYVNEKNYLILSLKYILPLFLEHVLESLWSCIMKKLGQKFVILTKLLCISRMFGNNVLNQSS